MARVATRRMSDYDLPVAVLAATRRSNRKLGAQAPSIGAFFVRFPSSMVGDAGQSVRAGRVPSSRFATPASSAALAVASDSADSNLTRSLSC